MVFLDLNKAFDRVWHMLLFNFLLGVKDPMLSWLVVICQIDNEE